MAAVKKKPAKKAQETPETAAPEIVAKEPKLTDRQQVFIEEYLKCWNASEAARRAGYVNRSNTAAAQIMSNDVIQEAIQARIAEKAMSADEVLLRLAEQARGDHAEFFEFQGGTMVFLNLEQMRQSGKMHLVKEYEVDGTTGRLTKVKFHDSQSALVHLGRHHKLFTDNVNNTGTTTNVNISAEDAAEAAQQIAEFRAAMKEQLGDV